MADPQRKEIVHDTYGSRIVMVCPYQSFVEELAGPIKRLFPGSDLDAIKEADLPGPPYLDVQKREEGQKTPLLVLDFGYVRVPEGVEILDENYRRHIVEAEISELRKRVLDYATGEGKWILEQDDAGYALRGLFQKVDSELIALKQRLLGAWNPRPTGKATDKVMFVDAYDGWCKSRNVAYARARYETAKQMHGLFNDGTDLGNFRESWLRVTHELQGPFLHSIKDDIATIAGNLLGGTKSPPLLFDFRY
jgi:hypothetical protein